MAADAARKRATYQDVLDAPEHHVAELIDSELYTHPRPASPHARAASKLGGALDGPFDTGRGGPGGWILLHEPELHLGADVVVPDLGGWRRERMPEMPHEPFFTLAPDWVCEVLSPSTARVDRVKKLPVYASAGVRHVWLVDPLAQTLEVLRLTPSGYLLAQSFGAADEVRAEPFDAVPLALAVLWSR